MVAAESPPTFCRDESLDAGEPLAGTAVERAVWVLLEYPGQWGRKAFEEAQLPAAARDRVEAFAVGDSRVRVQLIRRPGGLQAAGPQLFVALVSPRLAASRVYRLELASYADLATIDFESLVAPRAPADVEIWSEPLFVVCTHGKRDACCAKFGCAFHARLAEALPGPVWQTSHLGGHRFAPTLLQLPSGYNYGRVPLDDIPQLIAAHAAAEVHDPRTLRGRVCYSRPAQAAEIYIRRTLNMTSIADVEIGALSHDAPSQTWRVALVAGGRPYTLRVRRADLGRVARKSCAKDVLEPVMGLEVTPLAQAVR